jgi:hypothetical protein
MRFSRDRRGQSVVIGTVILFGFLILALSLYQVQVVPQQNGQTEFEHFEEVRNDLVELRAGILQAGSTDRPQYQTVRLGTSYPTRIFAINPPSPAGSIRTTQSYPITIAYASNGTVIETVPTRFLQYRPGYNEIDQSPTWYDASVLYVDARDEGSGIAVIEDQELVDSNGAVQIVALQNEFRRSGTGRVTLEFRPAENITETLPEANLTVTVPTRLSENDWETKTDLPTDSDVYGGVTDDTNDDGVYNLTLNTTADNLTVDTVGVGEAPEDATQSESGAVAGGDGGNDGSGDPATVVAVGDESLGNKGTIDTRFDLSNSDGSVDTIRVYIEDTPGQPLGGDWSRKTVTINGKSFELTTDAADDIGLAEGERDLFDATNYENVTQSELNDLRDGVTTGSLIENLQQNGSEDLNIRIVER